MNSQGVFDKFIRPLSDLIICHSCKAPGYQAGPLIVICEKAYITLNNDLMNNQGVLGK